MGMVGSMSELSITALNPKNCDETVIYIVDSEFYYTIHMFY